MIDVPTPSQTRDELERAVIADLLGPADGPKEIVDERNIRDRYLVGRLAPRGHSALPEQSDDATLGGPDGEDGLTEAPPPKAATLFPSSIGLTFAVSGDAPALQITARWGRYERVRIEDDAYRNKDGTLRSVWRRVPVEAVSAPISLRPGRLPDWSPDPDRPDVFVQGLARLREEQSSELVEEWVVTLFLVNGQQKPARNTDEAWLFQPELVVAAPDGSAVFQKRPALLDDAELETQTMAMLYRRRVEFAVGHGIAVQAELAPGQVDRATRLRTVVVPAYEVPQTTPPTVEEIPALAGLTLDMKALSQVADGDFSAQLSPLVGAYAAWIEAQAARIAAEPDLAPYRDAARHAIAHCRRTLERIRAGVALLDADPQAAHAFRFANRAMHQQRVRSLYAAGVRRAQSPNLAEIDIPPNHSWRTFQLAFILLNLPSLTDLTHPDRSPISNTQHLHRAADAVQVSPIPNPQYPISPTADLLWFPTGGGKTEAYLGLAAYVMGLRRLQGEIAGRSGHAGVAVLMRYTLRLLTLQQFQRATALLCACEVIRREDPGLWGSEPFRIGLWVGRRSTPNWTQEADEAVKQLRRDAYVGGGRGTPHQLTNCPWCGAKIEPGRDIEVETPERGRGRTFIYCGDRLGRCPFGRRQSPAEGIPALVVDEEIYRRLPSLLIATVDKFAQMPWNGRTAMLFGQVDGYCERHGYRSPEIEDSDRHPKKGKHPPARTLPAAPLRPPDLIIQDELHLINGPLGTLVGLYETAVDRLASWEVDRQRVRPKVIASTATIRRAEGQVHNLFLRRVNVFPPHGLDAEDNFFSRQREPSAEHPGRRYLGLCAQGVRHKTALIRAYVAFLAAAQKLYEQPGTDADPWMTLVGYFNSLRELGSLRRAVDDTVTTRLRWMKQRNLARRYLNPWRVVELTSRRSAADIPEILDRLETVFKPSREGQKPRRDVSKLPVDVLLATNMISVGVDVGRLGLMVVASQPKTTAEYIQATSRVGRRHPGLVCTVYNWARPRDLSHYERFAHYHATFYQHVEALSVTPFSPRALDRGLGAVFVSLVRLLGLELNANDGAAAFSKEHPHAL
ncbi:MAG: DISARM system helicase DrmA, partial [Anaerolineae bacterium]